MILSLGVSPMRRREFITLFGSAGVTWPFAARAQQPAMPVVGFVTGRSAEASVRQAAAFRKGLNETGYVEGQNVMVEYHWLEGRYERLPALMTDLAGPSNLSPSRRIIGFPRPIPNASLSKPVG